MSPKAMIPIEDIVEAAWKLVGEKGATGLSARALATKMGTSTMPIYSSIGNMDELGRLLRERVARAIAEYQGRSWSSNSMLDAAAGYVHFARDEPRLFQYLWQPAEGAERLSLEGLAAMTQGNSGAIASSGSPEAEDGAGSEQANPEISRFLASLPRAERGGLEFHVWIFVHGIACLVADGLVDLDDGSLLSHLEAAGGAFYLYHSQRKEGGA